MGGYGSGRHSNNPAASQVKRVDIRYMRKQGLLKPAAKGLLSWTSDDKPTENVGYRIQGNTLFLDYNVSARSGEWDTVCLTVPMVSTPCRYGGRRYYFRCPDQNCNRRCEVLYSKSKYFLCRKCCRYLYSSQLDDRIDRRRDARAKVGKQIFENFDGTLGWLKKKGMHQKTFDRGYTRFRKLDELWNREFIKRSNALLGANGESGTFL
jgi:hypothetical protein